MVISKKEIKLIRDNAEDGSNESKLLSYISTLERKLSETEERIQHRLLAAVQYLCQTDCAFEEILIELDKNYSFDKLQVERNIAQKAEDEARSLKEIYVAALNFLRANNTFNACQKNNNLLNLDVSRDTNPLQAISEAQNKFIIAREKLFSLIKEHKIKENFMEIM